MKTEFENLGFAIREIRSALGISQTALAESVGLSKVSMSKIETGKTTPRPETLATIAEELDVPETIIRLYAVDVKKADELNPEFTSILTTAKAAAQRAIEVKKLARLAQGQ
ncbi:MAG: helix-turn-helix transcriptional regulator [Planctomycetaceae bacterium]|nr:helix-turn-helix transcriptional regulator [Planctomycetaceae bacterium]